jgi:hypothetical protein
VLLCARHVVHCTCVRSSHAPCSGLASQRIHVCVHPASFTRVMAAMRRLGRHLTHLYFTQNKLMAYCNNLTYAHIQARLLVCDTPMPLG